MNKIAILALLVLATSAQDPAGSWLSYAAYDAGSSHTVTRVDATWVVPNQPAQRSGSNAPGWWYGVQTSRGDGALIQPVLAYDYYNPQAYYMFNAVYDWTDGSWHSYTGFNVSPGDTITSYTKQVSDRVFEMWSSNGAQETTNQYTLESGQTEKESVVYFVLEHQPNTCAAYPTDGVCTFTDIKVEVDGASVTPKWTTGYPQNACNSHVDIVDSSTIKITWDTSVESTPVSSNSLPSKWGFGRNFFLN